MTPQLFINYKLKSVEHLPWRVLMYKVNFLLFLFSPREEIPFLSGMARIPNSSHLHPTPFFCFSHQEKISRSFQVWPASPILLFLFDYHPEKISRSSPPWPASQFFFFAC